MRRLTREASTPNLSAASFVLSSFIVGLLPHGEFTRKRDSFKIEDELPSASLILSEDES